MNLKASLLVLLAVVIGTWTGDVQAAEDVIRLGVFPRKGAVETRASYVPIASYLSARIGKKVEVVLSKDFPAFWEAVKRRDFELVFYNQYHYVKSHKELGYDVIVMNEELGSARVRAAVVVRSDSGIASLADLRGKRVVFGGSKQAMQAYIGALLLLKNAGLKPGDYTESFAVSPPNAVIAVFNRMADAGGTGEPVLGLPSVKEKIDVAQLRILAKGEELPNLCWAVKKELDPGIAERIAKALIGLKKDPAGAPLLKGADVTAFLPATDKEFDAVRRVVKEALGEEY